jgi:hypothetical protein
MMCMPEQPRGTDRAGRRAKRFLSPSQKYEIWLQLVRGETTLADAAARWQVDRSTILRIRTVAKDGALAALAAPARLSRPSALMRPSVTPTTTAHRCSPPRRLEGHVL